jgi:hypothetical protein
MPFSSKDAPEAGMADRPYISSTGPATPPPQRMAPASHGQSPAAGRGDGACRTSRISPSPAPAPR